MSNIAIIGAGMSGLSALHALSIAGHQVTLFDKSRGSGGRMASKRLEDTSWDMGAQFLHARTETFANQLTDWEAEGLIQRWNITPWVIHPSDSIQDQTLSDAELKEAEYRAAPSPDERKRYVPTPRMTGLSRHLLKAAGDFVASTRIQDISGEAGNWTLTAEDGRRFSDYQAVIIATPPEQAHALIHQIPELAHHCDQDMLPCWTLLTHFKTPLNTGFDAAFVKNGPISWIARNNAKPQRAPAETWVIQADHHWSQQQVDSPRHQVQAALTQAFWEAVQQPEIEPTQTWLHRWLYAIPEQPLIPKVATDHTGTLALAGDWLHSGSLEGAWLSGQKTAKQLISTIKQEN